MKKNNFADLVETFAILRGPNGCPWDKKQTHGSLIKCLQNESQELIDAINKKDDENMKEVRGCAFAGVNAQPDCRRRGQIYH